MTFDTYLLDEVQAKRRAGRERERQIMLERVRQLLDARGPHYGIRQAYIAGSLITPGRFDERLRVDIAVETIDPIRIFDAIGEFSTVLGREVDLIQLDRCHFTQRLRQRGVPWTATS